MDRKHNKALNDNAKALRKNMTKEEQKLWYGFLRSYPVKFLRQKILGRYIADFYSASAKLVVELDGGQHFSEEGLKYDCQRSAYLEQYGIKVIRVANNDIWHHFDGVCKYIDEEVKKRGQSPQPPFTQGGKRTIPPTPLCTRGGRTIPLYTRGKKGKT